MATSDTHRLTRERLTKMRDESNGALYPNDLAQCTSINAINLEFAKQSREELSAQVNRRVVVGRLMARRGNFMVIQESPLTEDRIQLYMDSKAECFKTTPELLRRVELWDIGDIVTGGGVLHRSNKGDLYVKLDTESVVPQLVSKSLRPPPEKYHGLKDTEARARRRYLDLIYNADSWNIVAKRSKLLTALRKLLDERGYMEVETPMLHVLPGGAVAKPFVTHHQALDQKMYLRISPELYLKRLIIGGLKQVYEIGNSFRNEGLSPRHNPEFSMLELYKAYATCEDMIALLCDLLKQLIPPPHTVVFCGEEYNFSNIKTCGFLDCLQEKHPNLGMDIAAMEQALQDPSADKKLCAYLRKHDIDADASWGNAKLLLELFEKTVEPNLSQPVCVTDYPAAMSPLARPYDKRPWLAERFEFIACGIEIANGCSELNDPAKQQENFNQQAGMRNDGDEEAMQDDSDFIEAMEYGMPPTAGLGVGIDRLVMLCCDTSSVRTARLFPHLRNLK